MNPCCIKAGGGQQGRAYGSAVRCLSAPSYAVRSLTGKPQDGKLRSFPTFHLQSASESIHLPFYWLRLKAIMVFVQEKQNLRIKLGPKIFPLMQRTKTSPKNPQCISNVLGNLHSSTARDRGSLKIDTTRVEDPDLMAAVLHCLSHFYALWYRMGCFILSRQLWVRAGSYVHTGAFISIKLSPQANYLHDK